MPGRVNRNKTRRDIKKAVDLSNDQSVLLIGIIAAFLFIIKYSESIPSW